VWYIGGKRGDFDTFEAQVGSRLFYLGSRFHDTLKPLLEALRDYRDAGYVIT
jgi:hypothetical protein